MVTHADGKMTVMKEFSYTHMSLTMGAWCTLQDRTGKHRAARRQGEQEPVRCLLWVRHGREAGLQWTGLNYFSGLWGTEAAPSGLVLQRLGPRDSGPEHES